MCTSVYSCVYIYICVCVCDCVYIYIYAYVNKCRYVSLNSTGAALQSCYTSKKNPKFRVTGFVLASPLTIDARGVPAALKQWRQVRGRAKEPQWMDARECQRCPHDTGTPHEAMKLRTMMAGRQARS